MKMNITMDEAIKLIAQFWTPLGGCYVDELCENALAKKFVDAECTSLDEEYQDKYKINEQGNEVLYPFGCQIAEDFIKFMKRNDRACSAHGINDWFAQQYHLDSETAEVIADYFCHMLGRFSLEYTIVSAHSSKIGNGFAIREKEI